MTGAVWNDLKALCPLSALELPPHLSSIEDMAAWVAGQLKENTVLMGHSMGALVALEASGHPAVTDVILLGAAATMPVNADLLKTARDDPARAAELVLKWSVPSSNPRSSEIKSALAKTMRPETIAAHLTACDEYKNGAARAREFQKPALVISGALDKMAPAAGAESLSRLFSRGRFMLLPDRGHMPMAESPEETAAAIRSFIDINNPNA